MFPSIIANLTNPAATDKMNVISHSSVESAQNTEITAIETFIGTLSSAVGTLVYDIRSANSNGGGHLQSADKGGTGQTSYNKGDILVASSSSVLGKLAVGADGLAIVADSTQTGGLGYKGVATAANIQQQTYSYARASVMSASVYGVNLSQAVSVLSDGLGLVVKFPVTNTTSVLALSVNATGPSSIAARIKNMDGTNPIVGAVQASMIGIVEFDSVSSVFQLQNSYIPTYGSDTSKFLRNDGQFASVVAAITTLNNGLATRAGNAASGSQTIAHGLGATPKYVRITGRKMFVSGTNTALIISDGSYNGSTTICIAEVVTQVPGGGEATDTTNIIRIDDDGSAAKLQVATISVDATNITLNWTLTGTPNTQTINIFWEAFV